MSNLFAPAAGRAWLMDGAMGTQLQKAGVHAGECFELWNLTHPDSVRSIHQSYADAGAELLLTNTFQANPVQLERRGLLQRGAEICGAAVELARSVQARSAGQVRWVLGDVGPIGGGPGSAAFPGPEPLWQMAAWLTGVDALLLETCSDGSAWAALDWLRQKNHVPLLLSLTFHRGGDGFLQTWDRHRPEDVARLANDHPLAGLGVNCGVDMGISDLADIMRRFRAETDLLLFARPNAGTPVQCQTEGGWTYPATPQSMAAELPSLLAAGAGMIGGCCGTTPEHIAAFRKVLG